MNSCDLCGKLKATLNNTNWARHLEACKNKRRKLKHFDISKFFSPTRGKYLFIKLFKSCIFNLKYRL